MPGMKICNTSTGVHYAVHNNVNNAVQNVNKNHPGPECRGRQLGEGVKIGYARVSTKWYQSEVQLAQLEGQGCDKVWSETDFSRDGSDDGF